MGSALFFIFSLTFLICLEPVEVLSERSADFPFLWFLDSFDVLNASVWKTDPCLQIGSSAITLNGSTVNCNLIPNTLGSAWDLPKGAPISAAQIVVNGASFPKSYCCTPPIEIGVANLTYSRSITGPEVVWWNTYCDHAGVCLNVASYQCTLLQGTMTEYWGFQGSTLQSAINGVCTGDQCGCGGGYNPSAKLPSSNFTTVRQFHVSNHIIAVQLIKYGPQTIQVISPRGTSGQSDALLPGLTTTVSVPSSAVPLNGTKLNWIKLSVVNTDLAGNDPAGFYVYNVDRGEERLLFSFQTYNDVQVLFPGQCYDGNSAQGDGCGNNSYVEPFCKCHRNGHTWGLSECFCVKSASTLPLLSIDSSTTLLGPDTTALEGTDTINIPFTTNPVVTFSSCVHPSLDCSHPNATRHLAILVNGTLQMGGEKFLDSSLSLDISSFGAPFPIGTTLQFFWWSNVNPGMPAGLFSLDGPVVAMTPQFRVVNWIPTTFPTPAGGSRTVVGGYLYNISFTSNVRFPSSVDVWLYEGSVPYSEPLSYNFTDDGNLIPATIVDCQHAFSGPIEHNCLLRVPEITGPSLSAYLVARVHYDISAGTINSINMVVLKKPAIYPLDHPYPRDSSVIRVHGDFLHEKATFWISVNESLVEFYYNQRNYTYLELGLANRMAADSRIILWWDLYNATDFYDIGVTFNSPPSVTPQFSQYFYLDNATITIKGEGFVEDLSATHVRLRQPGVPGSAPKLSVLSASSNQIVVRLMSRLSFGAISVWVSVYDGSESFETYIGFFVSQSVYDQAPYPSSIDLSNAPLMKFKLSAVGIQDGPPLSTIEAVRMVIADTLSIPSSDLYARLSWRKDWGTSYELSCWFVSSLAVSAFNAKAPASNTSAMNLISDVVNSTTNWVYNCSVLSTSVAIDPFWLYLVFQLGSSNPAQPTQPSNTELVAIVDFLKLYWKLDTVDLFATQKMATDGSTVELTIFFRTTAAQQLFLSRRLPENSEVVNGAVETLISSAINDNYSVKFLSGSPLPVEQVVINVEWPWLKFRLSPTDVWFGYPNETSAVNNVAQLGSAFCDLNPSDVLVIVTSVSTKKRAPSSADFDLVLYFTSSRGMAQFDVLSLPDNVTIIEKLNSIHKSTFSYNSTYMGSNRNTHGVVQPLTLGWQAFVGIGAAVVFVFVLIIVGVVLYRNKFREIWTAKKLAVKAPEAMAALFSIKASQLELGAKLGSGSFGTVYKGKYQNKTVAIKKLAANMIASQVSEFFSEASLMLSIEKHPNIVTFYGMCQELGNFSMVMEYLPRGSLEDYLKERKVKEGNVLSEEEFYRIARGVALGMRCLARSRVVHRDLATRNILLGARGVPKVADFGFSRTVGDEQVGKTQSDIGPVRWMAPENVARREFSEKSDVWSYGALLIEMITGDVPFPGQELLKVATFVRDGQGSALNFLPQGISAPSWVFELLPMCFHFDPTERPTFSEIIEFLNTRVPAGVTVDYANEDVWSDNLIAATEESENSAPPRNVAEPDHYEMVALQQRASDDPASPSSDEKGNKAYSDDGDDQIAEHYTSLAVDADPQLPEHYSAIMIDNATQ